jgi:hypothetical protein
MAVLGFISRHGLSAIRCDNLREVKVGCGHWYLDLCLVAYSIVLESDCQFLFHP